MRKTKKIHKSDNILNSFDVKKIIIYFLIIIYPLISRVKIVRTGLENCDALPSMLNEKVDIFLYYKSITLLVIMAAMTIILVDYYIIQGRKQKLSKVWFLLLVFEVLAIISVLFSDYKAYSVKNGMIDSFESVWIIIAYGVIVFYTYSVLDVQKDGYKIMLAVIISTCLQSILGLWQILNRDWMNTTLVKKILFPASLYDSLGNLGFYAGESEKMRVYGTLYNTNYAGIFFAMAIPVFLGLIYHCFKSKKKRFYCSFEFWLEIAGVFMALVCLIGTGAKTSWITLIIVSLLLFAIYIIKSHKKVGIVFLFFAMLLSLAVGIYWGHNEKKDFLNDKRLETINVCDNYIEIIYDHQILHASYIEEVDGPKLILTDETGNFLSASVYDNLRFEAYQKDGISYLMITCNDINWRFTTYANDDNSFSYINIWGEPDQIVEAKTILPEWMDSLFTGRGYIWSRTIPLLKQTFLLGTGADTCLCYFPNKDYVNKSYLGYAFYKDIISKPHSLYLQTALQQGVMAMICVSLFVAYYIFVTAKKYFLQEKITVCSVVCISVVLIYLISGFLNDSNLITTPMACVWVGMGMKLVE